MKRYAKNKVIYSQRLLFSNFGAKKIDMKKYRNQNISEVIYVKLNALVVAMVVSNLYVNRITDRTNVLPTNELIEIRKKVLSKLLLEIR